jgi:methyl-accepting chemotaxis protein
MNSTIQTVIRGGLAAAVLVVASGCTADLTKAQQALSDRVNTLEKSLASAKSAADAASATASEAKQTASGAQSTANQALNAANQSQSCCDATNEKIDRMFKRSQAK